MNRVTNQIKQVSAKSPGGWFIMNLVVVALMGVLSVMGAAGNDWGKIIQPDVLIPAALAGLSAVSLALGKSPLR